MKNTKVFFDAYRREYGRLNQTQVDGLNLLLTMICGIDKRHAAYMLATVKHECADKWQPVIEFGNRAYFDQYEPNTKKGKRLGNKIMGDGYAYRGRGYVQITGRSNYEKLSQEIGVDLLTIPDMTLDQKHSFNIMKIGMEKGLFTGKKLSDYINDNKCDYVQARRIINGMDRARLIAGYAEFFEAAL